LEVRGWRLDEEMVRFLTTEGTEFTEEQGAVTTRNKKWDARNKKQEARNKTGEKNLFNHI